MKRQHHAIYVPGILDDKLRIQSTIVATWRLYGVHGHCHEIPWAGAEAWRPKFQRLLAEIDKYHSQGHQVSLVGASAGASAVLNAYAERSDKINGLIYICAKINTPETVSQKTYDENPAFKTSLELLQANLPKLKPQDKVKMLSLYSPADGTVPYAATVIPGVKESQLPRLKHGRAILYSLSFGASGLARFIK
ncbi:MAG TPA: hypothetical protein VFH99_01470 [Candidatus Saccharimonadales bacterium]|nr:hypothetical protein [Candidatus Saccharimonadales bacterium]